MTSILSGIRVLDLSTIVAGPTASMILGDLGADIIKVERPGTGEDGRAMGPHRGEWGAYFTALNRGKRSIALDIRQPAGREAVLRLASTCDVFLENFRGGKAAQFGLDETAVRARKPDIIYASLSAYGPSGPDYKRPGYDAILQARTGIMSVTGDGGEMPVRSGVSILDMGTGVWTALGILAALFERQRSGKGQRVDASLFQTGVMFMSYHLLYRQFAGVNPKPQGSRHTAFAPYGAYSAADGAIMIGISSDQAFRRLVEALGQPELADDPRFRTNPDRVRNTPELDQILSAVLAPASAIPLDRGARRLRCRQRPRADAGPSDDGPSSRRPPTTRANRIARARECTVTALTAWLLAHAARDSGPSAARWRTYQGRPPGSRVFGIRD